MKTMTKNELWSQLQHSALVQGAMPEQHEKHSPWFVRAMLGVAGWIGALFLVGFVVTGMAMGIKEVGVYWFIGLLACGGAAVLFHLNRRGDFVSQFGLAVAIAGQILMVAGMSQWWEDSSFTAALSVVFVQQSLLFFFLPNYLHRVWAAGTATLALAFVMGRADLYALVLPLLTAALAVAWLHEFERPRQGDMIRACGYGITCTALLMSYMNPGDWLDWRTHSSVPTDLAILQVRRYMGQGLIIMVIIGAAILLLRREMVALTSGKGKAALALAIVLALASTQAPGLAPASLMLLLGFANGNRVLTGLGVVALLSYLSYYYYALHATLLEKSVLMMLTGIALLSLRFVSLRWWPTLKKEEPTHA
ncbi:uncharacterized protein DUF4401 [Roseimicrobium gellanilyticum]|uniref:Uncharacterized protein DUF4401 n=1 Tax=Roseimicrobium gellanilyticum TaxID=748857 RepID=A0A366H2E8_9BACT|nr:DUF4401 domain-containing protein [Roseimicrobium gellanilyticum]RBP36072.1 uncharacterized protein DUF4401 [Roseimicrobium gellanilyticum]